MTSYVFFHILFGKNGKICSISLFETEISQRYPFDWFTNEKFVLYFELMKDQEKSTSESANEFIKIEYINSNIS